MVQKSFVGIDIGKTKLAAGVITPGGKFINEAITTTDTSNEGYSVIDQCKSLIHRVIKESASDIDGIGVCACSIADSKSGMIQFSSIKGIRSKNLGKILKEEFSVPVLVNNDVISPAYGEYLYGASKGSSLSVYMTISTGFGMGVVSNGDVYSGKHGIAGIVGPLEVYGKGKSLESVFSGSGIAALASKAMGREVSARKHSSFQKTPLTPVMQQ